MSNLPLIWKVISTAARERARVYVFIYSDISDNNNNRITGLQRDSKERVLFSVLDRIPFHIGKNSHKHISYGAYTIYL
jgi:hypothetical protein